MRENSRQEKEFQRRGETNWLWHRASESSGDMGNRENGLKMGCYARLAVGEVGRKGY